MKYSNAVLLHGKPKKEKFLDLLQPKQNVAHWHGWAMQQFAERGITTYAPTLPRPYDPSDASWSPVFDSMPMNERSLVIGRSAGARLVLKRMSERQELMVAKVILVAPWTDPRGNYDGLEKFEIDPDLPKRVVNGITVFYSSRDDAQAQESLESIRAALPNVTYRDIPHYGHYMIGNTMENEEFPELLEEI